MQVTTASISQKFAQPLSRVLGEFGGNEFGNNDGPLLIFIAGMHGNEPAGVIALQQVFATLNQTSPAFRGKLVGLAGNLPALAAGCRFIDEDLNRVWQNDRVRQIESGHAVSRSVEEQQQIELLKEIRRYTNQPHSTLAIIDLHTTSSQSRPFIPFDDTLINRHFVQQIPVSAILGIEEFLPGTLLSYLNELGGIALGYEAGQHDAQEAIDLHEALIWHALKVVGCLSLNQEPQRQETQRPETQRQENQSQMAQRLLDASEGGASFFEIVHRHEILPGQTFKMNGQFKSFAAIEKDQLIAHSDGQPVLAPQAGLIFMPLYQDSGNDGYFIVRPVNPGWLRLSRWFRRMRLDRWLVLLPGVRFDPVDKKTLLVNRRIARFLALQLFHLLGYRKQPSSKQPSSKPTSSDETVLRFRRREN